MQHQDRSAASRGSGKFSLGGPGLFARPKFHSDMMVLPWMCKQQRNTGREAAVEHVERSALLEFVQQRHRALLVTTRPDGGVEVSPVTCALDRDGWIVVASHPERLSTRNARCDPQVSICVMSDEWDGPFVQIDGQADVLDMPEAVDGLADYARCVHGDQPDRGSYPKQLFEQDRVLIRIDIECWSPLAAGGLSAGFVSA